MMGVHKSRNTAEREQWMVAENFILLSEGELDNFKGNKNKKKIDRVRTKKNEKTESCTKVGEVITKLKKTLVNASRHMVISIQTNKFFDLSSFSRYSGNKCWWILSSLLPLSSSIIIINPHALTHSLKKKKKSFSWISQRHLFPPRKAESTVASFIEIISHWSWIQYRYHIYSHFITTNNSFFSPPTHITWISLFASLISLQVDHERNQTLFLAVSYKRKLWWREPFGQGHSSSLAAQPSQQSSQTKATYTYYCFVVLWILKKRKHVFFNITKSQCRSCKMIRRAWHGWHSMTGFTVIIHPLVEDKGKTFVTSFKVVVFGLQNI